MKSPGLEERSAPHAAVNPLSRGASSRRRRVSTLLRLALTVPLGLVWRLAPLHLPPFAFKYGGSALWAMSVYWVVAFLLPGRRPALLGTLAAAIAVAVECFKRVQSPGLDAFRSTLAGKLLLGRYFTVGALIAYSLAFFAVAIVDAQLTTRRAETG